MKKYLVILAFLLPTLVFANQDFGFLKQNLWVSPDPFFSGETVRVYTVIFNGGDTDISGKVGFFDNNESVGEVDFSLAGSGRLRDVWFDWPASEGEHRLSAKIVGAVVTNGDGSSLALILEEQASGEIIRQVDVDTDGDRIGDILDEDDDNDGLTDEEEALLGTDSKKVDTDGDGLNDKEDPAPKIFNLEGPKNIEVAKLGSETGLAQVASSGAFNVLEKFRTAQVAGLEDKKEELKSALGQQAAVVAEEQDAIAGEKNAAVDAFNEAAGQDVLMVVNENTGLPDLSLTRVLKLLYLGVVYIGLFIFDHKTVFYSLLGLIGLKFLFILFRRVFRR
ncbi:MAG: hypothetical protein COU10_01245 [Candidatus Harrisonbacteria bacterium CG10_big_fil_rev_8_21_14_0_10_45_28]|uniref:CARDB domain-containing protein n=1 Tax=Candidatus Harrisonbacteria bacterium CG10_big_fil_rev_8_21_14_0_10_45_28 TaxID=1974586 RepID=A0A2H0UQW0_9BACT|nr:MAG: hypothetical protein COU10_01245 [Candidatus Harrisonbacteria bacterium CG10_big_fil_rev_8_21_14_0_10_45_28]